MKQILFSVFIALTFSAWAQAPQPAAKEAAKPAPMKEAPKEAAKGEPAKQAAVTPKKPRRWNEDARHCLERGSTTEIIKCAEEYL
jgi:hypothetical protein